MRTILLTMAALAAGSCGAVSPSVQSSVPSVPVTATFDSLTSNLVVTGARSVSLKLNWASRELQIFQIPSVDGDDQPDLIRFFSTAYYGALDQRHGDVVIYSRNIRVDQITTDVRNLIANGFGPPPKITPTDTQFANVRWTVRRLNQAQDRSLCGDDHGYALLNKLRGGLCYVSCSGQSMIAADLLPGFKRVVLLFADTAPLSGNMVFMKSEWHTTVEYVHDNRWYVADPTLGFAFVTDAKGIRLDTRGLIAALDANQGADLTFGVTRRGKLHAVPGNKFLEREGTLSSIYYTPDKRLEYVVR